MVQSAINAGYKTDPLKKAQLLLSKKDIADEIASIIKNRQKIVSHMALVGYEKLAFYDIADCISLLYMESPTKEQLKDMDMSCVSEIKKLKDGAMEIKFFDRNKALEKLRLFEENDKSTATGLVDALKKGAENLNSCEGDTGGV